MEIHWPFDSGNVQFNMHYCCPKAESAHRAGKLADMMCRLRKSRPSTEECIIFF